MERAPNPLNSRVFGLSCSHRLSAQSSILHHALSFYESDFDDQSSSKSIMNEERARSKCQQFRFTNTQKRRRRRGYYLCYYGEHHRRCTFVLAKMLYNGIPTDDFANRIQAFQGLDLIEVGVISHLDK